MDVIIHFLIEHGLWGMFIAAFFAGSILPLASEVVLSALVAAGVAPLELLIVSQSPSLGAWQTLCASFWILGRAPFLDTHLGLSHHHRPRLFESQPATHPPHAHFR